METYMAGSNLIYTLCRRVRQILCNEVLHGVHQILYNLFVQVRDKDSAVIYLETDNRDIVDKIDGVFKNVIGMSLFKHEEDNNQYSLDISFENLLSLYTWLNMQYK